MNDALFKSKYRIGSVRLEGYDYGTNGAYFITICNHDRSHTFSEIENGNVVLYPLGRIIREEWERTSIVRPEVTTTEFIIMPNHFHGIVFIHQDSDGPDHLPQTGNHLYFPEGYRNKFGPQKRNLSSIVRGLKSAVTQRARLSGISGKTWQRNFHEHIIRNEAELARIAFYIRNNPFAWDKEEMPPGERLRKGMKMWREKTGRSSGRLLCKLAFVLQTGDECLAE